ncbi:MAG: hypothetical protein AB1489_01610 [Acidobacteriota bacterium]
MRYLLTALTLIFMITLTAASAAGQDQLPTPPQDQLATPPPPPPQTITINANTVCRLQLLTALSSKLNEVGDTFSAELVEPIRVDDVVALPRGTVFEGRVTQISEAKRGQRRASMMITIERVITAEGPKPVEMILLSIDDYANEEKLYPNEEGKVKSKRDGGQTVDNVIRGGVVGSLGSAIAIYSGAGGAVAATTLGVGVAGGVLLTKGKEIRLFEGTILRIKFAKPLSLTVN